MHLLGLKKRKKNNQVYQEKINYCPNDIFLFHVLLKESLFSQNNTIKVHFVLCNWDSLD